MSDLGKLTHLFELTYRTFEGYANVVSVTENQVPQEEEAGQVHCGWQEVGQQARSGEEAAEAAEDIY